MFSSVVTILKRIVPNSSPKFLAVHATIPSILLSAKMKANGKIIYALHPIFQNTLIPFIPSGDYSRELTERKKKAVQSENYISFSQVRAKVVSIGQTRYSQLVKAASSWLYQVRLDEREATPLVLELAKMPHHVNGSFVVRSRKDEHLALFPDVPFLDTPDEDISKRA